MSCCTVARDATLHTSRAMAAPSLVH
jgi:hypothetical protein